VYLNKIVNYYNNIYNNYIMIDGNKVRVIDKNLMKCKENPLKDNDFTFNNTCETSECGGGFKTKNVLPYNHLRKVSAPVNKNGEIVKYNGTIEVLKDPLSLSVDDQNSCTIHDNKWRIIYTESQIKQIEQNRKDFMSSSALLESRNKSYEQNINIVLSEKNKKLWINKESENGKLFFIKNNTKNNKTIIRYSNPKFLNNGAVSSRNRIAALKNGNYHNNIYKKRCDDQIEYQKKKFTVPEKMCKPYHYGGKMGISLLRCQKS